MSQTRIEKFRALAEHAWFGRVYAKLTKAQLIQCEEWIAKHDHLNPVAFEMAVHRMFLDQPKPKGWERMTELIHCCR